jgi:hypothetical protein
MPSLFATLFEPKASDAIDGLYGEVFLIERKVKGTVFGSVADGSRPAVYVAGIMDVNPITTTLQDKSSYDGLQPQVAGEKYHVSFDVSKFTDPSALPQKDDFLTAGTLTATGGVDTFLKNPAFPTVRVLTVDPDGIGRVVCVCSRAT